MDLVPTLRVISRTGVGVDNICVRDATARRIVVCNAPEAPTISTAEHALTLLLAVAKDIKRADPTRPPQGKDDHFTSYNGLEVRGLSLGVVGLGRIGRCVANLAQRLGLRVLAYDPYLSAGSTAALGIELAPTLEAVLQKADVVSLHVPLTSETRHLINVQSLEWMKPGAILINTARGGLIDEAALLDALQRRHLRGAGLDVFEREPPDPHNPLFHRDDVVATPHIASATGACKNRLWETAITQALQVLNGVRPEYLVNPEIWPLTE